MLLTQSGRGRASWCSFSASISSIYTLEQNWTAHQHGLSLAHLLPPSFWMHRPSSSFFSASIPRLIPSVIPTLPKFSKYLEKKGYKLLLQSKYFYHEVFYLKFKLSWSKRSSQALPFPSFLKT